MADAHHSASPVAAWRSSLTRWRKAVVGAWAEPESVTLLQLSSDEVAHALHQVREKSARQPHG